VYRTDGGMVNGESKKEIIIMTDFFVKFSSVGGKQFFQGHSR